MHHFELQSWLRRACASLVVMGLAVLAAPACLDDRAQDDTDEPSLRRPGDPWVCTDLQQDSPECLGSESTAMQRPSSGGAAGAASGGTTAQCDPLPAPEAGVTLAGLFAELVDLQRLTQLPEPAYESRFVSSHDRASDTAAPGDDAWFANQDFIALGPDETRVLLDAEGPGAITRIWSASPQGTVRIYIDGAEEPAVEADFGALLRGEVAPFDPPFAFVVAGGHNLYFPIPFARSCKITLTGETQSVYFHVSYRQYAQDTAVESLGEASLQGSECLRSLVGERLSGLRPDSDATQAGDQRAFMLRSDDPEASAVIEAGADGGMLWQLRILPDTADPDLLRATILSLRFDDAETVRVPLGDFFATAGEAGDVNSVPLGVEQGAVMTARWPMPFQHRAEIALESTGAGVLEARVEVASEALAWTARSLYFHAQWHAPETFASDPPHDWNMATIEGDGLYVGNVLNVVNRAPGWWGEGDEKITIDDEAFPSHFGTGTEDYYGYAWCSNEPFSTSYIGQPASTSRRNFGALSLYRFHVLDAIRFQRSLRFAMEVRHWGDPVDVTYDAVSFWYAGPDSRMSEAAAEPAAFRLPELGVDEPQDTPAGPYRCGG